MIASWNAGYKDKRVSVKNKPDGLFFTRLFVQGRHKQLLMAEENLSAQFLFAPLFTLRNGD